MRVSPTWPRAKEDLVEIEKAAEKLKGKWKGNDIPARQVRRGPFNSAHIGFSFGGGQKVRKPLISLLYTLTNHVFTDCPEFLHFQV